MTEQPQQPATRYPSLGPRVRYGVAIAIAVVASGVCAWAQFSPSLDHQVRFLVQGPTAAGTAIVLVLWLVLTASWPWVRRFMVLGCIAAVVLALLGAVRIDETSGNVVPVRFAWRWSPKRDRELAAAFADLVDGTADLAATSPENYPQFLGPDRQATVAGPALDGDWAAHPPRELWRRRIGAAWSSFAVVGNYAVTQEQRGDKELVVCYELATGKPVWYHADTGRFEETLAGVGPRATPTVADGRVYAVGALGILNCLDGATGKPLWSRDILTDNSAENLHWGKSCSPLVVDDLAIVSAGGPDGRSLVAYNRLTGELVWHAGDDPSSYSSPHLATLAGVRQVVIVNQQSVVGHAVDDGRVLWRFEWPGMEPKCSQPLLIDEDMILVSAGYGLGGALLRVQPAQEGEEGEEAEPSDTELSVKQMWAPRNVLSLKSKFANMVLFDGFVYALDDGVLSCVEPALGRRRWKGGRYGHGQLLLVDNRLLVMGEKGDLAIVDPNPRAFKELGRIQVLPGKTWNNPAISGRYLLVRNHEEAACYELPLAARPWAAPAGE
ncbi:MAG: PQQ-like beta-propeller repeat protein [Planctomycetia bacterium]|nr:PQQ-like beta-propeller repeat protein [Planctomycetia bacterium]